jgi:hypothetical protein
MTIRREMRRGAAVEPVIGHLKAIMEIHKSYVPETERYYEPGSIP